MVTLVCGKDKCEVSEIVAQSRLKIQKASGHGSWELPKDSPYEFKDNALIKRTGTKDCKGKAKPKRASGGSKASGETKVSHGNDTPEA